MHPDRRYQAREKRFGFSQFRFAATAILLLAAGLKAVQLASAPLSPVVQGSVFTPLLEQLNGRYFLMANKISGQSVPESGHFACSKADF